MKLREYITKIEADTNYGERDKYLYLLGSILSDKYLYKFGKRPDKTPEVINGETILSNDYPIAFIEQYFFYAIEDLLEFINSENPSETADDLPF